MIDNTNTIPTTITAGNSLTRLINFDDYPASDGWLLSLVLLNAAGKITIDAVASGDSHSLQIPALTTAAYTPGEYRYVVLASNGDERHTAQTGQIEILPDPVNIDSYDGRSHAEICLANIEAILEGKATADNYSYSIAGLSLSKYSWDELLTARTKYKNEVIRERRAIRNRGKSQQNIIKMKFA